MQMIERTEDQMRVLVCMHVYTVLLLRDLAGKHTSAASWALRC